MRARLVTYGMVAVLAVCVLAGAEWWPFSSFRLFSQARTAATTSWQVVVVDEAGTEHAIPFGRLPRSYRGVHHLAPGLPRLPPARRDAVCRAWAGAGDDELDVQATEVRVYRIDGRLPAGGGPATVVSRTLSTTCARTAP